MGHISEIAIKHISEAFGRRLQDTGVTRIQWIALYYLKTKGKISQRDLSNLMNVTDSSAGRLIDRLERDDLIRRETNTTDRRVSNVYLTQKGDRVITQLLPYGVAFNYELIEGIDEKDLHTYQRVLNKMISNIINK